MKKKLLTKFCAVAMAVAMVGTMVGCGDDDNTPAGNDNTTPGTEQQGGNDQQGGDQQGDDQQGGDEQGGEEANANQPLPTWEAYDCGGATIRIAAEQIFDATREEDKDGDRANDYTKKWEYLHALEEKYNCKFEIVTLDSTGYDEAEAILNNFANGLGYADIFTKGPDVMLKVRNYLATVEDRDQLKMGSAFIDAASWNGVDYGFTYDNIGECFVLCYSRDYLKSVGMEKTPGDMFQEGKWSYEDALEYFTELQSKLPAGSYAIGVASYHYAWMAGGTNGVLGCSLDGDINIDDPRYIEALTYYRRLLDAGVAAPITGYSEGADNTVEYTDDAHMPGESLADMCGYSGANEYVLTNVQNWQHGDPASGGTDWGIVPYPWGPEVSVEGFDENGMPILKNYFVARVDFTNVLVSGAEYRGEGSKDIPDWVLFQIVREYEDMRSVSSTEPAGQTPGVGSGQAWINSYAAEKRGESAGNVSFSPNDMRQFTQMQDVQIWNWISSNVQIDFCKTLNGMGVPFNRNSTFVIAVGKDAKASAEALKPIGVQKVEELKQK